MTGELDGRTIVILGAGGGLGPVAARAAAAAGAKVVLVDRDLALLQELRSELGDAVVAADAVDLLDDEATTAYAGSLESVDAVWHLVGGWKGGQPVEESPIADWALLHDLIVRTTVHAVRAFTVPLTNSPYGRFVIISSPNATKPTSKNAAYGAMKAAAEALVFSLADRFSGTPATANVIVVPAILTPAMAAKNPNRPGFVPAQDIATTLIYLTSDAAARITAQRLLLGSRDPQPA